MTGRLYVGGDVSAETIARAVVRRTGGNARQCVSFRAKEIINGSPERRDHPSFASPRRIQRELTVRAAHLAGQVLIRVFPTVMALPVP